MPGSGKSTLACALEAAGVAEAVDLDGLVEARCGISVADIFRTNGEAEFRRMEADAIGMLVSMRAVDSLPLVVSTGGGAPCHGGNMERMLAAGTVVWLQSEAGRTVQRLAAAPGQRPAVDRAIMAGELRQWHDRLLAEREPFYSRAHAVFDSTELDDAPAVAAAVARFRKMFMI